MNENYIYPLRKVLKYTRKDGKEADFAETGEITFEPPSMDVFDESADFEQMLMQAVMSASKGREAKEADDGKKDEIPTAREIKMLLYSADAKDVSVKAIAKVFRKLAMKTGKLDEKMRLKDSHFGKLDIEDFKDMMCGYANFFSFPSILKEEEETEKIGSD